MSETSSSGGSATAPAERPAVIPELLDVRSVAALLGCGARHVQRMADNDWMPAPVKLGALSRWRRTEIAQWIEGGCRHVRQNGGA